MALRDTEIGKRTACYFCRIMLNTWHPTHDEILIHRAISPFCPLLNNLHTDNIPIDEAMLKFLLQPMPTKPFPIQISVPFNDPALEHQAATRLYPNIAATQIPYTYFSADAIVTIIH